MEPGAQNRPMTTRRSFLSAIPALLAIPAVGILPPKAEPVSLTVSTSEPITGIIGLGNGNVLLCTDKGRLFTRDGQPFRLNGDVNPLVPEFYLKTQGKIPEALKAHLRR